MAPPSALSRVFDRIPPSQPFLPSLWSCDGFTFGTDDSEWVLLRFGVTDVASMTAVSGILVFYPITFDTSSWYAGGGFFALALVTAVALYGFRTALAPVAFSSCLTLKGHLDRCALRLSVQHGFGSAARSGGNWNASHSCEVFPNYTERALNGQWREV